MTKTIPRCPRCGKNMVKTGTKNRGEERPIRIFQCMDVICRNPAKYNRQGEQL